AESVVFYDYAELLACLTADWCSGLAATRWWWQALLKRGDVSQIIRQLWREKIEYVPAALEHVVRKGVVVEFVSRLSDVEVMEIVERVISVFGVTRIARIKATDFFPLYEAREERYVPRLRREMPWKHVVPESDTPQLRPVQQLFVGTVLMVYRAPARVRTVSFAREVEHWIQEHVIVEAPPAQAQQIATIEETKQPTSIHAPKPLATIRENPINTDQVVSKPAPTPEGSVKSAVKTPEPIKLANAIFHYEEPAEVTTVVPVTETDPIIETPPPEPVEVSATAPEPLDDITIETDLGGLFYLINLAIFLEIYNDFTSPVEKLHDDLSIWDFVAIVGKEIDQENSDDEIWEFLRNLADRDHELITPAWLLDLLPHIRARLNLALGINDDLAPILLHHHAKVTITPTHLDVHFSLCDHPIEIRLSGLDRNPGWMPAAGRFIAFHYD
ncbi:MAG TPA: hypothetical protein VK868_07885, partial [Pyrinomonadaceae bacterium]|nr:hypothetical protein [Pyrinomonadaceae bacterium]